MCRHCALAAVPCDHLIAVPLRPDQGRDEDAKVSDTVCQILHFLIVPHLKRMAGEIGDRLEGKVHDLLKLLLLPCLLCLKELIARRQGEPDAASFRHP